MSKGLFRLANISLLTCVLLASVACPHAPEVETPSLRQLLPRIKPTPPDRALDTFRIEKGFRIELVAAEPLVTDPIALAFDAQGRMYVCEDRDYPFPAAKGKAPIGRVRLLEDINGDGRYDKSTVFADQVHWPSGVVCHQGGVFVAAPPQILYLKDTNGDGNADQRKVVYDGFGTSTAEDIMNNLKWGLDHKIYGVASYNGGEVRGPQKEAEPVSVRGSSFRFDPVTMKFERLAGTGDFGNCFDDWGNRFVTNAGQLLMHPVLAEPYLDRNPHLAVGNVLHRCSAKKQDMHSISPPEPWRVVRKKFWNRWVNTTHEMRAARFSDAELAERGFVTGAAGSAIYRGDVFGDDYRENSFTTEPAGNVVIRLKVKPNGVTFDADATSDQEEFLASTDNWFRPVNIANGPDGCLYVCDMYREVIEDPSAIPGDILKLIDVTHGRDHGRIYRIAPAKFHRRQPPSLHKAGSAELLAALEDPNAWTRETAQRLLHERQDRSVLPALRKLCRTSEFAQGRLHSLYLLNGLSACTEETLLTALNDEHPAIRQHAARLCDSRISASRSLAKKVASLANDDHPRVRMQVAFTLGEWEDRTPALAALASIARRDAGDEWIRTAVLSSVHSEAGLLYSALVPDADFAETVAGDRLLQQLLELVGVRGDAGEVSLALKNSLERDQPGAHVLRLAAGLDRGGHSFSAAAQSLPVASRRALDSLMKRSAATAVDRGLPQASREEAAQLLALASFAHAADPLSKLLTAAEPKEIQIAAVRSLGRLGDERQVAATIIDRWPALTPNVRREAAVAMLASPVRTEMLLQAVKAGRIAASELDPPIQQTLISHPNQALQDFAKQVFAGATAQSRLAVIEKYRPSLQLKGDSGRGKLVFQAQCAACHAFRGAGKQVGPDLATVNNRSAEQLLLQILDPNREVKPQYLNYTATLDSGRIYTGVIAAESPRSVTLLRAEGAKDVLLRSRIDELRSTGLSLMPDGMESKLSLQQMADLLAYLRS